MTDKVAGCVLCRESDLTFWRGDGVAMLFDPVPLVEGHALIYSSSHHPSAADAPASVAAEMEVLCARLRRLYLAEYGAYTLFEHGRTGSCLRRSPDERICHHMHVHVLPLPGDLTDEVGLGQRMRWKTWSEVAFLADEIDSYVLIETGSGRFFYPVTRVLPPHFLRTQAARLAGDTGLADWEEAIDRPANADLIARARKRFGAAIASRSTVEDWSA